MRIVLISLPFRWAKWASDQPLSYKSSHSRVSLIDGAFFLGIFYPLDSLISLPVIRYNIIICSYQC
ncbi:hypothetical protein C1O63_0542 [Dehalococcoides mccartyi]|nr:hypothetical protein C1O63_0542 [Dehalococcoides mccartyi]